LKKSDMKKDNDPYRVLGIPAHATWEEKKSAYRNALRLSHPDTGGSAEAFAAVQQAWEAISQEPSSPTGSSRLPPQSSPSSWMKKTETPATPQTVGARSYGHPGGWFRQRYAEEVREWVGLGAKLENVFDPDLVARAPSHIVHTLAAAIAEENTAVRLSGLGPGNTVWHDVVVSGDREQGVTKIDHVVLAGNLLWAIQSEDWGASVSVHGAELTSAQMARGDRPVKKLRAMTKKLQRNLGVVFSGCVFVVAENQLVQPRSVVSDRGRLPCYLIADTHVVDFLLEQSMTHTSRKLVGDDMFPVRERIQAGIRFV
jgi:hypothetical protein